MHGLINRAIEMFVRQTYGTKTWIGLAEKLALETVEFEPILTYDDDLTLAVLSELSAQLERDIPDILEDIGTFLVTHSSTEALRRLLRFSGRDFIEFLYSLEDLPARAQLAIDDLNLPHIELREHALERFSIIVRDVALDELPLGYVLLGLLRALADDFGALVLLEHKGTKDGTETISVCILNASHNEGRPFVLGTIA